ncbi:hypothetical protein [Bradyrhizobium liaoningense]|uniref:hypothetical protein n=1 Tax=Bradyrhizobium liaoningense TaxID=43992 RepID=UPI0020139368|nr:hypothetical protein [Bradyrhizobium liaoningense]
MTPLLSLTFRNFLCPARCACYGHSCARELLSTRDSLLERLPVLFRILPFFIVLSVVVCYLFNLTTTKWRFFSLPDALSVLRAATVLTVSLVALDYAFLARNVYEAFFLGKMTIILYWFLQVFLLSSSRFACRYFRYTRKLHHARQSRAAPALTVGQAADLEILLRAIENGSVKAIWPVGPLSLSRADRGNWCAISR